MLTLTDGHLHALYKDAEGFSWFGSLIYMKAGAEHIPMTIGNERIMLEFVIPEHLTNNNYEPKYLITGLNEHYLLRRSYRELRIYRVNEYGVMDFVIDDDSLLTNPEMAPGFISLIQNAVCYYVSISPETRQFIFQARGVFSMLMMSLLTNIDPELKSRFIIKIIDELSPPFFGFEIEMNK
ncbi:hypothetical protein [unidentified bacterial endosymbiont]|uniref:hypothetical protein n=1 Tax=unidentified bacterial endosymbiont TaxID=2355 RepID=UPI00209F9DA8|nr:hypothetical protein [unidentified bacterial endosymbiont]